MTCKGNVRKYHSDIKNNYEKVWKIGFRTEISSFRKKGYRFNNEGIRSVNDILFKIFRSNREPK
jgi:hypothetical protein